LADISKVSGGHIKTVKKNIDNHQEGSLFWDANKTEQFIEPASWRIVKRSEHEDAEEVVFMIRGIIHTKELPPITLKPR
jgi:hypothetical protein